MLSRLIDQSGLHLQLRPHRPLRTVARLWIAFIGCVLALVLAAWAAPVHAQGFEQNPLLLDSPSKPVPAWDFSGETLSGKKIRLSQFRGQVVFLNFWATWCTPCLLEMPAMERLNKKLAGRPFKMLAINQAEELAQVQKFATEHRYTFELVLDPIGEISSAFNVDRLPMTYVLDREGRVIRRAIGPREWDSPAAIQFFETLMESAARSTPSTAQAER